MRNKHTPEEQFFSALTNTDPKKIDEAPKQVAKSLTKNKDLVSAHVPVSNIDLGKVTPLHYAAAYNKVDIVRLLIAAGADVNTPGYDMITKTPDCTPLDIIAQRMNAAKIGRKQASAEFEYRDKYISLIEAGGILKKAFNRTIATEITKCGVRNLLSEKKNVLIYALLTQSLPKEIAKHIISGIIAVSSKANLENPPSLTKEFAIAHLLKNDSKNVRKFAQKQIEPQSHVDKVKEEKDKKENKKSRFF